MIFSVKVGGPPVAWRRPDLCVNMPGGHELARIFRAAPHPAALRRALMRVCSAGVRPHKDHPIVDFKRTVEAAARVRMAARGPLEGPVALRLRFWMPRPKAENWKTKPTPEYPHIKRPDLDNLTKGIKDALNGVAYRDDSQVAGLIAIKKTCAGGESPCVIIQWGDFDDFVFDGDH